MSPEDVREINRSRLEEWQQNCDEFRVTATLLVSVGEGGAVYVCGPDEISQREALDILYRAQRLVASRKPVIIPKK
jgi:hypothetical protein